MKTIAECPPPSARFDWLMAVLGSLVIAGIFQDGWAHNHGLVDQSFFTPWHAVLYGTMALSGLVLLGCGLLNLRRGYSFRNGLPYGYWLSAIGVALFLAAGLLDMLWHTLFGIEENISALVSPTHLLLALAGAFVVAGPIRSIANRVPPDAPPRWRDVGPAVLSFASILALLAFFTVYANPIGSTDAAAVIGTSHRSPVVANLYAMRADGSHQTRLFTSHHDLFGAAASPDGKQIVYRSAAANGNTAQLFVARADGSGAHQITHVAGWASQPAWSPGGKRIAFVSIPVGRAGSYRLLVVDRSGAHLRTVVESVAEINGPAWTPHGHHILYGTRNGLDRQIAAIDARGGKPSFIPGTQGGWFPALSRGGTWLAFTHSGRATSSVWLARRDGTDARMLVAGASLPAFSPHARRLAYVLGAHGFGDIGVMNLTTHAAQNVSRLSGMNASRPQWTPDGHILYTAGANKPVLDTEIAQAFALDTFLVSSVLLMGAILVLLRRFGAPLGAITVLTAMYAIELATQQDHYFAIAPAIGTAIAADAAIGMLRNRVRSGVAFYAFAFLIPSVSAALFLVAVAMRYGGIGWPPNLTFGTPLLCGFAGLLIAFCCAVPLAQPAVPAFSGKEQSDQRMVNPATLPSLTHR